MSKQALGTTRYTTKWLYRRIVPVFNLSFLLWSVVHKHAALYVTQNMFKELHLEESILRSLRLLFN